MKEQITSMLEEGVIRPAHSPWSSPIVLVKKQDGTYRFYLDFRGLNAVTKKDSYPIPLIQDIFDKMRGAKVFSTLDLRLGYWQIQMTKQDIEKMAFVADDALWESVR